MRGAAVVLAVLLLAGCTTQVAGIAQPAASAPGMSTSFVPCDLTDAQVASFGLTPSSKESTAIPGIAEGCQWSNERTAVSISTGAQSVDDLKARTGFTHVTPLTVGGREAVSFLLAGDDNGCSVAISLGTGNVVVDVTLQYTAIGTVDPCPIAKDTATKLAPSLP